MGLKENFTPEEWQNLASLPYAAAMTVMMASPNLLGVWGETKAMMQQPASLAAASGSSLVGLLSAEVQSRAKDLIQEQQADWKRDQAGYLARTLEAARAATGALAKVPAEEADAYRQWVLDTATRVAEDSKEGGAAVSEQEQAALAELTGALGTGAP
jgi:hypothetical protein